MAGDAQSGVNRLAALESTPELTPRRATIACSRRRREVRKTAHWVFKADFCKEISGCISPA
jgi:hypothetical protein